MGFLNKIKHKLARKIRESRHEISFRISGAVPSEISHSRGLRILVYHGVCSGDPHLFNARYVSTSQFEAHLQLIKSLYNPVSYNDLIAGRLSKDKLNVLLTFDDGLKNNHTHALPLLKKHGLPALFFVTALSPTPWPYIFNDLTDIIPFVGPGKISINGMSFDKKKIHLHRRYINAGGESLASLYHGSSYEKRRKVMEQLLSAVPGKALEPFGDYFQLMNESEICDIASTSGMAVGAHGAYHTDLSCLTATDLEKELNTCMDYLEHVLKNKPGCIAFPYGSHNLQVLDACISAGFSHCFGTEKLAEAGSVANLYGRMTVNPYVSAINQMYYIAKNNYE